ncbi:hypothetical protein FB107DRAFT_279082 [Schizophyllum commune]
MSRSSYVMSLSSYVMSLSSYILSRSSYIMSLSSYIMSCSSYSMSLSSYLGPFSASDHSGMSLHPPIDMKNLVTLSPRAATYRIQTVDTELAPGAWLVLSESGAQGHFMGLRYSDAPHDDSDLSEAGEIDMDEPVDQHDVPLLYARLIAPAMHPARAEAARRGRRGPARANGAAVMVLRQWAELEGPRAKTHLRNPERVAIEAPVVVPCSRIVGQYCGAVDVSHLTELGIDNRHGRPRLAWPPMDGNDQYIRHRIPSIRTDVPEREYICADGLCLVPGRIWDTTRRGQIRYCPNCLSFFHVGCLVRHGAEVALSDYVDFFGEREQAHLHFLLQPDRPSAIPALPSVIWGNDTGTDADVDDAANLFPWPHATCAELACVPLRRRTMPAQAPQSMETITQEAIRRTRAGMGAEVVPDPAEAGWLRGPEVVGVAERVRASKLIVIKELRRMRSGAGPRRFLCMNCHHQII